MAWLTVSEVRACLDGKVGTSTIYAMAKRGELQAVSFGGRLLIDSDSLQDRIARGRIGARTGRVPPPDVRREMRRSG